MERLWHVRNMEQRQFLSLSMLPSQMSLRSCQRCTLWEKLEWRLTVQGLTRSIRALVGANQLYTGSVRVEISSIFRKFGKGGPRNIKFKPFFTVLRETLKINAENVLNLEVMNSSRKGDILMNFEFSWQFVILTVRSDEIIQVSV